MILPNPFLDAVFLIEKEFQEIQWWQVFVWNEIFLGQLVGFLEVDHTSSELSIPQKIS